MLIKPIWFSEMAGFGWASLIFHRTFKSGKILAWYILPLSFFHFLTFISEKGLLPCALEFIFLSLESQIVDFFKIQDSNNQIFLIVFYHD
jgi:hypothetical protein